MIHSFSHHYQQPATTHRPHGMLERNNTHSTSFLESMNEQLHGINIDDVTSGISYLNTAMHNRSDSLHAKNELASFEEQAEKYRVALDILIKQHELTSSHADKEKERISAAFHTLHELYHKINELKRMPSANISIDTQAFILELFTGMEQEKTKADSHNNHEIQHLEKQMRQVASDAGIDIKTAINMLNDINDSKRSASSIKHQYGDTKIPLNKASKV